MSGRSLMVSFIGIILAVICMDQVTKILILHNFALYESKVMISGFFNLTYITNNGAAFSMLAGQPALWRQIFFISAAGAALIFIWLAQRSFGRNSSLYTTALALIAGGAIGNLIDRIRFGFVIDFLDFFLGVNHFPAFNIADSAITVGVILFIFKNIVLERHQAKHE